ncbi:MAG: hypothetical protein CVU41_07590 [Chloroflexi bacterium HGW-Chloroflexi-3]|nr:MAG: hypothetical protein CVU41_07590 [Chloroflexi bacterium HGW-Chloroflexi-3]
MREQSVDLVKVFTQVMKALSKNQQTLDVGDLVTAGMAYFQAKQQGKIGMNALIDAFVAASGMGSSPHRQQSTPLVANTFMQALER